MSKRSWRKQKPKTAREVAHRVLVRVEEDQAYSQLALHEELQAAQLSRADASLATELVYGTIQRLSTIDYFLGRFIKGGPAKLEGWVRQLLRMGFYQLHYLDRIPQHAAVNESVNMAKSYSHAGIAGLVNGVLRSIIRERGKLTLPNHLSARAKIALAHAHPPWMIDQWSDQYSEAVAEQIAEANNLPPDSSLRINPLQTTTEEVIAELKDAGFDPEISPLYASGISIRGGGNPAHLAGYREGRFSIQDGSSMMVAQAVDPQPGERVLDVCAAPGGKSYHMAELMANKGEVVANDIHPHKQELLTAQGQRLSLSIVQPHTCDARKLADVFEEQSFDRVLVDAPCSGLGVIRRKPDLKWSKTAADAEAISHLQLEILDAASKLVKAGGTLVYSTCTIGRQENEDTVHAFLHTHPAFKLVPFSSRLQQTALAQTHQAQLKEGMLQVLPHQFGTDGFFMATLQHQPSTVLR